MAGMECRYTKLQCSGSRKPTLRSAMKAVRFSAKPLRRFDGRDRCPRCLTGAESLQTRVRAERFALVCLKIAIWNYSLIHQERSIDFKECRIAAPPVFGLRGTPTGWGSLCSMRPSPRRITPGPRKAAPNVGPVPNLAAERLKRCSRRSRIVCTSSEAAGFFAAIREAVLPASGIPPALIGSAGRYAPLQPGFLSSAVSGFR